MAELVEVGYNPFKAGGTPEDFRARYGSAAEKAGKALGVDPAVLLGQWGLETGWGKSVIPGTNNLGNIKDFAGGGVAATDNMNGSRDKYRAYDSPEAFADDFTSLIQRKYPAAVGAKDPLAFAQALKAGGYAEDPDYVTKVASAAKMAAPKGLLQRGVEAIIPSAQAAEPAKAPKLVPVDFDPFAKAEEKPQPSAGDRFVGGVVKGAKDLAGGLVRGAGSIGATLLAPGDAIQDAIAGRPLMTSNRERRTAMDSALESLGADPNSLLYGAGKLTGEVAGTAGVGPALAGGAKALGAGSQAVNALRTSGMTLGPGAAPGAANALTRVAGGAVTGGAAAGLVNPEDALTGAAIGGALPPVVKGLGAAGTALARTVRGPEVPANILSAATQAQKAGYVIPPTQVRPTLTNRILEGASGKLTTAQNASARNQAVTNRLAQSAIGAPELSPEGLQAVRAQANAAYSALGNAGELSADDAFRTALQKVGAPSSKLKQDFPALANKELEGIVDSFSNTKNFDAQSAIEAIKELRAAQRAGMGSQDPATVAMARAKGKISDALEDLVERNLTAKGNTDLLNAYREARQTLAKVYDVEKAMNPATGNVDARKLGNLLKKGRLTGDLKTAAEFAQSFPKAAQNVEGMGSLPQLSPLDWATAGGMSAATGSPLGAIGLVARPAARAATLSGPVQRGLTRPRNALSLSLDENALLPLYRGGPLLATDR